METEKIQKVRQILAEHLKDNKNILILGEDYLTGKTILLNKIMENFILLLMETNIQKLIMK